MVSRIVARMVSRVVSRRGLPSWSPRSRVWFPLVVSCMVGLPPIGLQNGFPYDISLQTPFFCVTINMIIAQNSNFVVMIRYKAKEFP